VLHLSLIFIHKNDAMIQQKVAVATTTPLLVDAAQKLAQQLELPFLPDYHQGEGYHYLLLFTPSFLGLQDTHNKKLSPFYIDFLSGKMQYRRQQSGLRKEFLARAIGIKPHEKPIIIDATAGLGRDSFILATLGYQVTMLERSPILWALLNDALQRAKQIPEMLATIQHMYLIQANAIDWMPKNCSIKPDIIYLDPMFPERKKSASVKKEMVILQNLLGSDKDTDKLFSIALTCASKRVVVKRQRLASYVMDRIPNHSISGKTSRFDIYLV